MKNKDEYISEIAKELIELEIEQIMRVKFLIEGMKKGKGQRN